MKSRIWMWMIAEYLFAALAMPVWTAAQDNPSQDKPQHKQYKLIDMGTFGGPASYIDVNGEGNNILDNSGVLVGWADTPDPDPYSPNCYDPDCYIAHAFRWNKGVKTDLGVLPGGYGSAAGSINEGGTIVGQSQNGVFDPLLSFPATHATLWTKDGIQDLGSLGGYESLAVYINNGGQVVGLSTNSIPDPYSLFGWGAQIHTFLWEKGAMHDIGTLGGPDAVPTAQCTNQRNDFIAGGAYTNDTPNPTTGLPTLDPFLWKNGKMLDLGTLGGTYGFAQCVNNSGQVTGQSNLSGDVITHVFFWDKGVLTDIGTFGGDNAFVLWLSDDGAVVGKADLPGSQTHDAFLWRRGVMTDLSRVQGDICSKANAINGQGQIVGNSSDCVTRLHAFLWEKGGPMVDLNTLIPPGSSLQLVDAMDINAHGEIAGVGVPAGCQPQDVEFCGHAYLLIPNGNCDGSCQQRVERSQAEAELRRQTPPAVTQRAEPALTPTERFRSMMRQRSLIPR